MSKYKKDGIEQMAAIFKALSNPQRLRIFLKLSACCAPERCRETSVESARRCVGELGEDLGLAASTLSHHLKELRQAGLMHVQRRGQKIECWISPETLDSLVAFFGDAVKRPAPKSDKTVRRMATNGR
jgi:ArsR family transcriptional regulator